MSTVLHPAGPEPAQTYWVRRLVVIAAAIVVLAVAGALIANGTSSGSAVQADPAPPAPTAPTVAADSPSATPKASASASGAGRTTPSASARPTAPASSSATPAPKPKPTKTPTPEPVTCDAGALRTTLTGKQRLAVRQRSTLTLSLINGSAQTCAASVNRDNFELRIYSGRDRIWSTKDCATIVKPLRKVLEAEEAVEWKLVWNGRRSRDGCKSRPEIPRPGTYYATAELTGAEPVRLLMILRG